MQSSLSQAHFSLAGDNLGAQTGSNYGVINVGTHGSQPASILRTLYLTNPKYDLRDILRMKGQVLDGTCEWILSQSDYLSWLLADSPELLRLVGGPGVGKTMMLTFLVTDIEWRKNEDFLVAYYFCDSQKELRRTTLAVLRGLVVQILQQRPDLQQYILPDFEIMGDKIRENIQALWNFILDVSTCKTVREMVLLIDAVDELDPDSQAELTTLFQRLFKYRSLGRQQIKILVTHRQDTLFEDQLADVSRQIDINANTTKHDVKKFIDQRISHLIKIRGYSPSLSQKVRSVIRENTEGTFLWASLILDDLESIKMNDKVRQRLQMVPRSLNEVYDRILSSIDTEDVERLALILQFVIAAQRPLTRKEIATICYFAERTDYYMQLTELPNADEIQDLNDCYRCCGALLFLDKETDTINLIHKSVRDYLNSPKAMQHWILQKRSVLFGRADLVFFNVLMQFLYTTCLSMGIKDFEFVFRSCLTPSGGLFEKKQIDSLVQYAITHYCRHALSVPNRFELGPFLPSVVSQCPIVFAYLLYQSITKNDTDLTKHLLSIGVDLTISFENGKTALHSAAEKSYFALVEILLDHGHPASQKDTDGRTALHLAVSAGEARAIRLLGSHQGGLLLNMQDNHGRTPLHLAVRNTVWTEDLGRLALTLLELGADPSIKSFAGKTPLEELQGLEKLRGNSKDQDSDQKALTEDVYALLMSSGHQNDKKTASDEEPANTPPSIGFIDEWEDYESDNNTDSSSSEELPAKLIVYRYNHLAKRESIEDLDRRERRMARGLWHQYVAVITQLLSGVNRKLDARSFMETVPIAKTTLPEYKVVYEEYMKFMEAYCVDQGHAIRAQADDNLLTFLVREWSKFDNAMDYTKVLLKNIDVHFVKRVYQWSGRHPETTYQLASTYWWDYVVEPVKKKLAAITDAEMECLARAQKFSIPDLMGLQSVTRGVIRVPESLYSFERSRYGSFNKEVARALDLKLGEAFGALSLQAPHRLARYTLRESESMFER